MTTHRHNTAILLTPKIHIPEDVIPFVKSLIESNLATVDYFGGELDNPVEVDADQFEDHFSSNSHITIHFDLDAENKLDYDTITEDEVLKLVYEVLDGNLKQLHRDELDVDMYIY